MRYDTTTDNAAEATALPVLSEDRAAAQTAKDLTPEERKRHDALVATELFKLRTAYPTQARNYTEREVRALNALWSEIFAEVDPGLLHEAVTRFIVSDRKGYFPSPGQILGCIEQIAAEREEPKKAEWLYGYR